jgi:SAM-dependent methyltransferase
VLAARYQTISNQIHRRRAEGGLPDLDPKAIKYGLPVACRWTGHLVVGMTGIVDAIRALRGVLGSPGPVDPIRLRTGSASPIRRVRQRVSDAADCDFYHVIQLPDGQLTTGQWDLRATADQYLGGIAVDGKRVIEIGPATGFLSFHMERRGARVVCVEPPMDAFWDLVPRPNNGIVFRQNFVQHITRIRNSFWYLHQLYRSNVESYEADVYDLPADIGRFDVAVLGSVLLHCCSPLEILQSVGNLVEGYFVICERYFGDIAGEPVSRLLPSRENGVNETWWEFSPLFFQQYLGVLGFPNSSVTRHRQWYATDQSWVDMFTVVAGR